MLNAVFVMIQCCLPSNPADNINIFIAHYKLSKAVSAYLTSPSFQAKFIYF